MPCHALSCYLPRLTVRNCPAARPCQGTHLTLALLAVASEWAIKRHQAFETGSAWCYVHRCSTQTVETYSGLICSAISVDPASVSRSRRCQNSESMIFSVLIPYSGQQDRQSFEEGGCLGNCEVSHSYRRDLTHSIIACLHHPDTSSWQGTDDYNKRNSLLKRKAPQVIQEVGPERMDGGKSNNNLRAIIQYWNFPPSTLPPHIHIHIQPCPIHASNNRVKALTLVCVGELAAVTDFYLFRSE